MSWNPNATVTVGGSDYTSQALIGASITYGRTNMYSQPRAGYARVSLAILNNSAVPISIGDEVVVAMEDSLGNPTTVFTGAVSDLSSTIESSNTFGVYLRCDLIAVSALARLNRRLAGGDDYPEQADGDRIAAILEQIYSTTWAEQPPTMEWQDEAPTRTWSGFDPFVGIIDTPGAYPLAAYTSGAANGYNLTTTAANSGLGVLYDTPDNRINYDDAFHRQNNASENGFWQIPLEAVIDRGLTRTTRLGDVANVIRLNYASGTVQVDNAQSVALYGPNAQVVDTVLADPTDALEQANRYLGLVDTPSPLFDSISLAVHQPDLDPATIDTALAVYNGQPVQVTGLPNGIGYAFTGFVEGWTWRIGKTTADLNLTVSDYGRSVVTTRWNGVGTTIWNTMDATLEWQEAIEV